MLWQPADALRFMKLLTPVLGLPILEITIVDGAYLHRGHYAPGHDLGIECLAIMCLAGSEGVFFAGSGDDYYGDAIDLDMVRRYLQPRSELEFIAEVARLRAAARRLVVSEQTNIEIIAAALMRRGTLSGDEVAELLQARSVDKAWQQHI
jgi:hypothetical protein